jgi:hypothetical protein
MLSDQDYLLTPIEAAVAGGHVEVMQLLVRNGATLNDRNLARLLCLARLSDAADAVAFLERESGPAVTSVDCSGVRLPW